MIDVNKDLAVRSNICILDEQGHLRNTCQEFGKVDAVLDVFVTAIVEECFRFLTNDRDYHDAANVEDYFSGKD